MIDFHDIVCTAVEPIRVRHAASYVSKYLVSTTNRLFEVSDSPDIIAENGKGTGIFNNPDEDKIDIFHLGNALYAAPRKINNLPSACDLILIDSNKKEIMLAELSESNSKSLLGINGSNKPGKIEKARNQLKSTIDIIAKTGFVEQPSKRTAIFFFRLPSNTDSVAARSLRAFSLNPVLSKVSSTRDPNYPDWTFHTYPYPYGYYIKD